MVIIGVREGYREVGLVAMRIGCAEMAGVVENLWNVRFAVQTRGFWAGWCGNLCSTWNSLAARTTKRGCSSLRYSWIIWSCGMFHVERYWRQKIFHLRLRRLLYPAIQFSDAGAAGG